MQYNKKIRLNNGIDIPVLALGTYLIDDEKVVEVVKNALQLGYRHIDTAQAYENERGVGEGIRLSGVPRNEIFIQTKLQAEIKDYETAKIAIEESLKKLGVDYIDLMIIHCPQPWACFRNGNHYEEGNLAAWRALSEFYQVGKIKAIGVSNFEIYDIENILKNSDIKPAVNQVSCHIGNTPIELIDYCKKHDIVFEAYSPLGHGRILDNKDIKLIADKYHVSVPQLCIRYTLQLGLVSIPKTTHLEYLKANADVDFEISDEDMKKLLLLNK